MIFVEPRVAYEGRKALSETRPVTSPRSPGDDWWVESVFSELREHGPEPMPFTALVNAVVEGGHYSRRNEREASKIRIFKLIGRLIRTGRLDRVGRKHITIPRTNARYRAYLESTAAPLDLPTPQL